MKKFVIGLLILCLVFVGIFGLVEMKPTEVYSEITPDAAAADNAEPSVTVIGGQNGTTEVQVAAEDSNTETTVSGEMDSSESATVATSVPETEVAENAEQHEEATTEPDTQSAKAGRLDYEALYGLYDPDEKVLKVNEKEENWGDYFYVLFTQCGQIEEYFDAMAAYYGMQFGWSDPIEEGGETYSEAALESADNLMIQLSALETFAKQNGVEVGEEMQSMIEAQMEQDAVSALGEEGTREAFLEYLKSIHLSEEMYARIVTQNFLYQESFNKIYGEKAEKLPEETAMQYLTDNGYISAAHILFLNTDAESGEALDEAALTGRKAELEALLTELRAIEDPLERRDAFLQKITDLSEDTGKSYYPEGYTYTPGTMVAEFESAAAALEEYEISDIVETSYGYHIIMRLPLSADAVVEFNSSTGAARTGRMLAANREYGEKLQNLADSLELEWLPGHDQPDLMSFIAEAE